MMIGVNGIAGSLFSARHTAMPSTFGIMMSSRMRSGRARARQGERLFAVPRHHHLVAVAREPRLEHADVRRRIVRDQDARRVPQPRGVYSPRFQCGSIAQIRSRHFSCAARWERVVALGGRGALVGPAQAARRLPRHRAPGPRHGGVRRVHHARHVAAERAARPGASAPRLVAADPPFARDADAPHGHGAAGARREGARVDPAREQPLQRGARAPRVGGGGFREAGDSEDPRRAGRGDDAGRRHRESRARREDRLGDAAAQHPRGSALPLDRRPGRRAGAEGECAHGRPARQPARHQPALARHHRQRRRWSRCCSRSRAASSSRGR